MVIKFIFLASILISFVQNSTHSVNVGFTANYIFWEELTDNQKEDILNSNYIYDKAILFYKMKSKISDNDESKSLLDTLSAMTNNEKVNAFYFFLFNQICLSSDGAVSDLLGNYCQRIILNSPEYVIEYFLRNDILLHKYAQYLGYELYY